MSRVRSFLLMLVLSIGIASCIHRVTPPIPIDAVKLVKASIARITVQTIMGEGACTAFAINQRMYLTADHCTPGKADWDFKIDGHKAFVIKADGITDLALVLTDIDKPTLSLREAPLVVDEDVKAMGYAYGFLQSVTIALKTQILEYTLEESIHPGTIFTPGVIGGMSGGPIFDHQGQIVGIVQRGSVMIAYGVSTKTLREFIYYHQGVKHSPDHKFQPY